MNFGVNWLNGEFWLHSNEFRASRAASIFNARDPDLRVICRSWIIVGIKCSTDFWCFVTLMSLITAASNHELGLNLARSIRNNNFMYENETN
jgi:hypothetical protein